MREPSGPVVGVVVFIHAIGENRTGNNYLFRDLGEACAAAGIASLRGDLPACGESRQLLDIDGLQRWTAGMEDVAAGEHPGVPLHWVARGLSAALLPATAVTGLRVALSPPRRETLRPMLVGEAEYLTPRAPLPPNGVQLWTMIGAEPNIAGGCIVPVEPLLWMCDRLDVRWDLDIGASEPSQALRAPNMALAIDPLFRMEADRAALRGLLPRLLRSWPRWRQELS